MKTAISPSLLGLAPEVLTSVQHELALTPGLQKAQVFGSRAKGNYKHGSDIDIALFGPQLTEQNLLALETRLDDLLLPYEIDLCHVDYLKNSALVAHIARVGVTIYSCS